MNSPITRDKYQRRLSKFFGFAEIQGVSLQEKALSFVHAARTDSSWVFTMVLRFLELQNARVNNREITGATVRNYVKAIKLFCEMADLPVQWKKLTRGLPRAKNYADDRIPSIEEIRKLLEYPDKNLKRNLKMNQWMTLKIMENPMRVVPSNNNYLKPMLHDNILSQLGLIFLSALLVSSFSFIPAFQSQASVQQPKVQPNTTDVSQMIKQIADKVEAANQGANATFVEQILTELSRQTATVSAPDLITRETHDIFSEVSIYPYGTVSQSLAGLANQLSADSTILLPTVQKIIQGKIGGQSILQSIVNIAVQEASGGGKNVNDEIALAAQIIAKQSPNIPLRNIEAIII
jgi:hypothetical protein